MNIFIGGLLLLSIVIGNIESMNMKTESVFLNIDNASDIRDPVLSDESSGICMPFYSCSSNANRTLCVLLTGFGIFIVCLRYRCSEYCDIKRELDNHTLQESGLYLPKQLSKGNEIYHV